MKNIPNPEIWFLTGSQHLYGEGPLRQVAENSKAIVDQLNASGRLPLRLVFKPVLTRPEEIRATLLEANGAPDCAGVITWCHTFSPSKMWINGLLQLRKPLLHLATQFNRDLPWAEIDMDFMNLNQAAHGDREHGFIHARLRLPRKVVVGHWSDGEVQDRVAAWMRVTRAWADWQKGRYVRFGDNMRQVAVTDGDKVAAEARFGFSVNTHGVGDLVEVMEAVDDALVDSLCAEYAETYDVASPLRKGGDLHAILRYNARQEIGLRSFLEQGGFTGFSDTFEDLHGLSQLPGLAVQRLMAEGYGFAGEGDGKTAAVVRAMKVISADLPGGASFSWCSAPTCWRSAPRSPRNVPVSRFIPSGSAARRIPPGWCSTPAPARPSTSPSWISATASASWSTRSMRSSRPMSFPSCPWRGPSGSAVPTSRLPSAPGSMPEEPTTPATVTRSPQNTSRILPKSRESRWRSSMRRQG